MRLHFVSPFSVTSAGGTIIQSSRFCVTSVGAIPARHTGEYIHKSRLWVALGTGC